MNYHATVRKAKRDCIKAALRETGGNVTRAAELMGINRQYAQKLIRDLRITIKRTTRYGHRGNAEWQALS